MRNGAMAGFVVWALLLNGDTLGEVDESGEPVKDATFLLMLNCHHEPIRFFLPQGPDDERWNVIIDTNDPNLDPDTRVIGAGDSIELVPLSLVLVREAKRASLTDIIGPDRRQGLASS